MIASYLNYLTNLNSLSKLRRMMNPDFADNFLMPRNSITGQELPNPRFISMRIHTGRMVRSKDVSNMFAQFGQFMDHDSTQVGFFGSMHCYGNFD